MADLYSMIMAEGKLNDNLRRVMKEKSAPFESEPSMEMDADDRSRPNLIKIESSFESGIRLLMSDYHLVRLMNAYLQDKSRPSDILRDWKIRHEIEFYTDEIKLYQESLTNIAMMGYKIESDK